MIETSSVKRARVVRLPPAVRPSCPCSTYNGGLTTHMCLAIPGQILEVVDETNRLAKVDVAGVQRNVNIGLLDEDGTSVGPGDWVLIHVGFAMSKIDEGEARETRRMLESMGEDYEQELEDLKTSIIE